MKCPFSLLLAAATATGCIASKSPYDYLENWMVREDAVRPFAVHADVIYVQDRLYFSTGALHEMYSLANDAVGNGKFKGVARVFSPLVADGEDMEKAVEWYLKHHNGAGRPFVFIGEGEGGALLKAYEAENAEWLAKKGLVASFYSERQDMGFVSEEIVRKVKDAAVRRRYMDQWGRDMPEGMMGE